jgi:non-ribosomal peptide synthetase component E (peptide arylation enzyme)
MLTLDELQSFCKSAGLANYKKPLSLDVVGEIPKTAAGKVFRRTLREPYWVVHERRVS